MSSRVVAGIFAAGLLVCACSGGGTASDAGPDALADGCPGCGGDTNADGEEDAGTDGDTDSGDMALGLGFGLLIPAGAQACTTGQMQFDLYEVYRANARVTSREGLIRLPREAEQGSADLFERVEFGPGRELLIPRAPGEFARSVETTPRGELYTYQFSQVFERQGGSYGLNLREAFLVVDGATERPLVVLDEAYLSQVDWTNALTLWGSDDGSRDHMFTTCRYDLFTPWPHRITAANGDTLILDHVWIQDDACIEACRMGFTGARFARGDTHRAVADFFRLAYIDGQHNWSWGFLSVFDEPVGPAFAVAVFEDELGAPPAEVQYLDAALQVIDRSAVVGYEHQ